jgi:hypothetical protein
MKAPTWRQSGQIETAREGSDKALAMLQQAGATGRGQDMAMRAIPTHFSGDVRSFTDRVRPRSTLIAHSIGVPTPTPAHAVRSPDR